MKTRIVFIGLVLLFLFLVFSFVNNGNAQSEQYYILHTNDIFDGRLVTIKQPAFNQYGDELVLVEFSNCLDQMLYPTCGYLGVRFSELELVR